MKISCNFWINDKCNAHPIFMPCAQVYLRVRTALFMIRRPFVTLPTDILISLRLTLLLLHFEYTIEVLISTSMRIRSVKASLASRYSNRLRLIGISYDGRLEKLNLLSIGRRRPICDRMLASNLFKTSSDLNINLNWLLTLIHIIRNTESDIWIVHRRNEKYFNESQTTFT